MDPARGVYILLFVALLGVYSLTLFAFKSKNFFNKDYLSFFVKEEKFRSLSVITIDVDEKYNVESLCQRLRELKIVEDIEPYRKLGRNQFRIGLFDNISIQDLEKLTQIISYAIENEEA